MKYEAPKMQMIEISVKDVIVTSGITGAGATGTVGGSGRED